MKIVGPSYTLNNREADVQRSVNMLPVANEALPGVAYMDSIPGLREFSPGVTETGALLLEDGCYLLLESSGFNLLDGAGVVVDPCAGLPLTIDFNSAGSIAGLEGEWSPLGVTFAFANTPVLDAFFDPDEIDLPYALSLLSGGDYFRVIGGDQFIYLSGYQPSKVTIQKLNLSNLDVILTDNLGGTDTFVLTGMGGLGLFESSGVMALSNAGRHIVSVKFAVAPGSLFLLDDVVFEC